jgi:voltage-gated potassium channel
MAAATPTLRQRTYALLDHGLAGTGGAAIVHKIIVALILANVAALVLETEPWLAERFGTLFTVIEVISIIAFTAEYAARVWSSVEHAPYAHLKPWRARLAYAMQPTTIIDLIAILPFYLALFLPADFRALLLFRLIRYFKLARYSPGMASLLEAVWSERRALMACLVILGGNVLIAATLMHLAERTAQPDKFGSIPQAAYWAVITLTTVGYGDAVPVTVAGKLITALTAITGLIMLALPVGIVASAFAREIHKRDFVVTWAMVARVPLFQGLDATTVADIMRLLKSQFAEEDEVVVRRGDVAHSMYFIASGEVEIELPETTVKLGEGHFFGEIAVLSDSRRTGTVRALKRTRLLALDAADLHVLMEEQPVVAEKIREIARARVVPERLGPQGDIAVEELRDTT